MAPLIEAAEKLAVEQFKAKGKSKPRDPFGIDDKGDTCCQEGGVVIWMPAQGGAVYSGKDKERWIQKAGKKDERTKIYSEDRSCF